MRKVVLSALLLLGLSSGCVGSHDPRSGEASLAHQAEPQPLDAVFNHPSPASIPGGLSDEHALLLVRIGRAPLAPFSLRRPIDDVIVSRMPHERLGVIREMNRYRTWGPDKRTCTRSSPQAEAPC